MSFLPLLLFQLVAFVALVMWLRKLLSRNLMDAASRLQGLNAEYSRRYEELKQHLGEAEQQYKEQMTRAKAEADRLVAQARQEAESSRTRLLDEARTESERIMQQALESRDALKQELERDIDARAIERACKLVQEVLPGQLRREVQSYWLDELIQHGLAQLDGVKTGNGVSEARVVSVFPLNDAQRRTLREHLKQQLGRDVVINEEADERLVAGLTITLGNLVLDGSLAAKLRDAVRRAKVTA